MSWTEWLREGRVEKHPRARSEIAALRRAADRSLTDATLEGLSPEGRFQFAYNAALELAAATVLASGYRVRSRPGHHQLMFEAARLALGEESAPALGYFERCRRIRNIINYEGDEIGSAQATELLSESKRFAVRVDRWFKQHHPGFA